MSKKRKKINLTKIILEILAVMVIFIIGNFKANIQEPIGNILEQQTSHAASYNLGEIPEYKDTPYVTINNNIPYFSEEDYTTKSFEKYSNLDSRFGRCGVAYANICKEIMPSDNEKRDELNYEPTGWCQEKYEDIVDGKFLYNRCHLIGWQLAGENNNKLNLITGTRYMNIEGMLPFENKVDNYIEDNPKNHVLYRVTPIFEANNLVASGVQMEAYSVEDKGAGIMFNVYVYNVQPGIVIDYKTGENWLEE